MFYFLQIATDYRFNKSMLPSFRGMCLLQRGIGNSVVILTARISSVIALGRGRNQCIKSCFYSHGQLVRLQDI